MTLRRFGRDKGEDADKGIDADTSAEAPEDDAVAADDASSDAPDATDEDADATSADEDGDGGDGGDDDEVAEKAPREPILPALRPVLIPTLVIALVGILAVATFVSTFRSFRPHKVEVAIAAPQPTVDLFTKQLGSGKDAVFKLTAVPEGQSPSEAVQDRSVYAALILGSKNWQLQYAGANGTILNSQLISAFQPASSAITYNSVDLAPAAKGDRSGWSVFFLVLGVVLAAFAFGLVLGFRRERLHRRAELTALAIFALVTGVLSTLAVRYGFDALKGGAFVPCVLQTLLAFSVAALTLAAVRVGRIYGAAIAGFILLVVGTALSGSLLPPPYLVPALQGFVNVLPSGMAAQGTTGASYFKGASFGVGLYGLAAWTIASLIILRFVDRYFAANDEDDAATA